MGCGSATRKSTRMDDILAHSFRGFCPGIPKERHLDDRENPRLEFWHESDLFGVGSTPRQSYDQ